MDKSLDEILSSIKIDEEVLIMLETALEQGFQPIGINDMSIEQFAELIAKYDNSYYDI